MRRVLSFLGLFFLLSVCVIDAAEWDAEYWQYVLLNQWEKGSCKLYALGDVRINKDISKFYYYRIAENFTYQVLPDLDLEAHYSFLYSKPRGAPRFHQSNRLEFEINPLFRFKNGITLRWRNRIQLIKGQGIPHIQFVFRHRFMTVFPIRDWGQLTSINVYDELHYHFDTNKITQNRFVPIELSFALNQHASMNIFLMIRNFINSNQWHRSIVVGSELKF